MNEHVTLAITALIHLKSHVMHQTAEAYKGMELLGMGKETAQLFAMNVAQDVKFQAAIAYLRGLEG